MQSVRVLPLLVFAGLCLFALKAMGLLLSGGYVLSGVAPASAQNPQATSVKEKAAPAEPAKPDQPAEAPDPEETSDAQPQDAEVAKGPEKAGEAPPKGMQDNQPAAGASEQKTDDETPDGPPRGTTKSELAVLEGLSGRRKALDQREREIDLRENLLKAAEKRVTSRINELKAIEGRIESELKKRDNHRQEQYTQLVKMYSGMKPKDAARIFDRLELNVLTALVSHMKPRIMSAILAAMNPAAAERLTLEIASRGKPVPRTAASLPKIDSQKTN